jgi:hypothetical protein
MVNDMQHDKLLWIAYFVNHPPVANPQLEETGPFTPKRVRHDVRKICFKPAQFGRDLHLHGSRQTSKVNFCLKRKLKPPHSG